jgi:hypothetical protein
MLLGSTASTGPTSAAGFGRAWRWTGAAEVAAAGGVCAGGSVAGDAGACSVVEELGD